MGNMKKRLLLFILLTTFSLYTFAEETDGDDRDRPDWLYERREYDLSGSIMKLSCFNYFSIGLGYNWGSYSVIGSHYGGTDYGFYIAYKTINEMHLRLYYNLFGGSAGILVGGSGIFATNFDKITSGIAPHIGIGFPGIKIFYRYNFYLNNSFNCHEIVFSLLFNRHNENRRR